MPDHLAKGAVYRVDQRDGKPPHIWIVLCDPREKDGSFLAVSLTDRHHVRWNTDVWPYGYRLTSNVTLAKPSAIHLLFAKIASERWLVKNGVEFLGICSDETLARARCNLFWFRKFLRPEVREYVAWYGDEWSDPCGDSP